MPTVAVIPQQADVLITDPGLVTLPSMQHTNNVLINSATVKDKDAYRPSHLGNEHNRLWSSATNGGSKTIFFGIEVTSELVWQAWQPGREYTKNIVLKNVKLKMEKIKYFVPESRFFTTLYPKPIILSPGTSFSLPVTFRPLETSSYEEKIQFISKEGSFEIAIRAVLPKVNISLPETVIFDMCATEDFQQLTFDVKCTGDLPAKIRWDSINPFIIEPMEATLQPGDVCSMTATFKPIGAVVYKAEAICRYGNEFSQSKSMKLHGIGKYPHLLVSVAGRPATASQEDNLEAVVQFGTVPVGVEAKKWIELHNLSPVRVPFRVHHPTAISRIDTVFSCPQKHGIVAPMSRLKVPVSFCPNTVNTTSNDYFHVVAIGNISKSVIKCVGSSKGPTMKLGARTVNFMQVDMGGYVTRTLDLINNSAVEAHFQFLIDCNESVFKFEATSGLLPPHSQRLLVLTFLPQHAINYYRRVTCLVHNQDPLILDLIGTCHSETMKPAVLQAKHIDRYHVHVQRGFSVFPPEQLNDLLLQKKLLLDDNGALKQPEDSEEDNVHPSSGTVSPMDEYFNDGFHSDIIHGTPHVSLDLDRANFGNCRNLRVIDDKIINMTNHTKGKVMVQWIGGADKMFTVIPTTIDIPPLKSCSFRITFKPNAPNQFFGCEMECYVFYKSLRDYRLVEDTTHCPPWCVTLTCAGNTFMPNNDTFLPRYTINDPHVVFPAVNAHESTYRTVLLRNEGTTPLTFDVEKDHGNIFSVKPSLGILRQGCQIFVVKTVPTEVKTYRKILNVKLNDLDKYTQELDLVSSAEAPLVVLDSNGQMFFKPTCLGTASHRPYAITNISRIPLRFEWRMVSTDAELLSVSPSEGLIQPNEILSQTWSFVPKGEEKSIMKPHLVVWGQGQSSNSSGGKKRQFILRAIGEGAIGDLKADESYVNFGDVVVGSCVTKHLTIYNHSNCSLQYRVIVEQTIDGPYPEEVTRRDAIALELDNMEDILPARSQKIIRASIRPIRRVTYQFTLSYRLLTPEDDNQSLSSNPHHLCHIIATGVFPVMAITDARCHGSAMGISKKQLWQLFSVESLNISLDADPSAEELMYSMSTRHSYKRRPPVFTRAIQEFNFSAAPLGSEPCIVSVLLENTGTVPTKWAFLFPRDLQLELDYWAESGDFDEDDLHEMKVMDNNLFVVEPKKGCLRPGETRVVNLTYKHTIAGTDRLPVLLKVDSGREILLNFVGVTVEPSRYYIHFSANKHMFSPVPVGEKTSPKQVYELHNGGALPVKFQFDLTPLDIIKQENFDQPIFECLDNVGEVLPGKTAQIEWRFSPIEAKTYMIDVPILVENGDTAVVTFTGVGYDKQALGSTMPITADQRESSTVSSTQSVSIPGQLVLLSQERLSFGNLPLFSHARRVVFLTNTSKDHDVSYEWHVTSTADRQFLSVYPLAGHLNPGQSQMCRVAFTASGAPSFYDLDLVCEITDETEMSVYRKQLSQWEDERDKQKYEFTITEHDLNADRRVAKNDPELKDRPRSGQLESLTASRKTLMSLQGELSKYSTLPPIQGMSFDDMQCAENMQRRFEELLWQRPIAPPPFLLHLGLTTRTHGVQQFQENFPDLYAQHFIDRALSDRLSRKVTKEIEHAALDKRIITCSDAETSIISEVLSNIFRSLMDDTYFHDALKKVAHEPVPYFCQFGQKPGSTGPSSVNSDRSVKSDISSQSSRVGSSPRQKHEQTATKKDENIPIKILVALEDSESPEVVEELVIDVPEAEPHKLDKKVKRITTFDLQKAYRDEKAMDEKQKLKKLPEFGNVVESTIENTLLNIIAEAVTSEFNIMARSRFIALPKRTSSMISHRSSHK